MMRNKRSIAHGVGCVMAAIISNVTVYGGATNPGPDVIVGELISVDQFGRSGSMVGLAVGTTSCNKGDTPLNWFSLPNTDHPVIPQNLYRLKNDRFEQIGQSWLKHAFTALQQDACGFGCQGGCGGGQLCSGCSDPYVSNLNANQGGLGSRAWVHPFTGEFTSAANNHAGHIHTGVTHRLRVFDGDLDQTVNAGALYFAEAIYVTPHEYLPNNGVSNNQFNNASYRQFVVVGFSGGTYSFFPAGETVQELPAVFAWPGATVKAIKPAPNVDGQAFIAYKVTGPIGTTWRYEYAIYNMNLDRAIGAFVVPINSNATISNVTFHSPPQHPGIANDGTAGSQGYSEAPWDSTQSGPRFTWACETIAENPNANAIRWGTLYNFGFDADVAPIFGAARLGMFKTGDSVVTAILAPDADCNGNGTGDSQDIFGGSSSDFNCNGIPDECEEFLTCLGDISPICPDGVVNINDLLKLIGLWGPCAKPCPPACSADIAPKGGNCNVNVDDLLTLISSWGSCQ